MPVYIFKVSKPSAPPSLVRAFPKEMFSEVNAFRLAKALLKRLRKSAAPADGDTFYKVYGATEKEAQKRLSKQLKGQGSRKRPAPSSVGA